MFHKCNSLESIVLPESIIKLEGMPLIVVII